MNIHIFASMRTSVCKTVLKVLAGLLVMAGALSSCSRVKDVAFTSFDIESVGMSGLRSVEVLLKVGVDNPAGDITVSDAAGSLNLDGKTIATFTSEGAAVPARSESVVRVPVKVNIEKNVSLFEAMACLKGNGLEDMTIDADAKVSLGKASRVVRVRDLKVEQYLKKK